VDGECVENRWKALRVRILNGNPNEKYKWESPNVEYRVAKWRVENWGVQHYLIATLVISGIGSSLGIAAEPLSGHKGRCMGDEDYQAG
jgi:hypothetical protein